MFLARSPEMQEGCSADNESGILGAQGVQKHSQGSKAASPFEKNGMESDYVLVVQENHRAKLGCKAEARWSKDFRMRLSETVFDLSVADGLLSS